MRRPERIAAGLVKFNGVDDLFDRFFNRCAGTDEITDAEFAVYAKDCFNEILNAHYGMPGYNYICENQDKFHDT